MNSVLDLIKYEVESTDIIGFYFAGDYCKYCKEFTPQLIDLYAELLNNNIELVYISSDKTPEQYANYRTPQPWPALPYEESVLRQSLREEFKIRTIPALLFFDAKTHRLLMRNGRDMIRDMPYETIAMLRGAVGLEDESDDDF